MSDCFQGSIHNLDYKRFKTRQACGSTDRKSSIFHRLKARAGPSPSEKQTTSEIDVNQPYLAKRRGRREAAMDAASWAAATLLWLPKTSQAEALRDAFQPPPDVKRLILCRHGQTELNRLGKIQVKSCMHGLLAQASIHTRVFGGADANCNNSEGFTSSG